jgi:hypothetical protein
VAARGPLDEAAALLLVDILSRRGIASRVVAREAASSHNIHALNPEGIKVFCVSYLEPATYNDARYLLRRLSKQLPGAHEISGFWCFANQDTRYLDAVEATKSEVITSLKDAAARITALVKGEKAPAASPPQAPRAAAPAPA